MVVGDFSYDGSHGELIINVRTNTKRLKPIRRWFINLLTVNISYLQFQCRVFTFYHEID